MSHQVTWTWCHAQGKLGWTVSSGACAGRSSHCSWAASLQAAGQCPYSYGRGPAIGPAHWPAVFPAAGQCVEGSRTLMSPLVRRGEGANGCELELLRLFEVACCMEQRHWTSGRGGGREKWRPYAHRILHPRVHRCFQMEGKVLLGQ